MNLSEWIERKVDEAQTCDEYGCNGTPPWYRGLIMQLYIVTVKVPRNPDHDPHNKITGACSATPTADCTDQTGEYHSYLVEAIDAQAARAHGEQMYGHVTRIETTALVGTAAHEHAELVALRQQVADTAGAATPETEREWGSFDPGRARGRVEPADIVDVMTADSEEGARADAMGYWRPSYHRPHGGSVCWREVTRGPWQEAR